MFRTFILLSALAVAAPACAKSSSALTASQQLVARAQTAAAQNRPSDALDLYETAVVADPRNTAAYIGLGRAYEQIGMQGRALRYYRLALDINPNDLGALEAQALGMIAKGVPTKAQASADRVRRLCPKGCPALTRIDAALSKARPQTSANARQAPRAALPARKSVTR